VPELPEVVVRKRLLDEYAVGREILRVRVVDKRIINGLSVRLLKRRLEGAVIKRVHRHGKYLFGELSTGGHLAWHFGMTGRLAYIPAEQPKPRHTKLLLEMDGGSVAFMCPRLFGWVSVIDNINEFIAARKLGPDALDSGLTRRRFVSMLAGRRGKLKAVLLDQSFVAGVGNLWADETCFQARMHPAAAIEKLDEDRCRLVYGTMRRVLKRAVSGGGDESKLPRGWLLPHRHGDGLCPRCGGDLSTAKVAGRTSWFCDNCQSDS